MAGCGAGGGRIALIFNTNNFAGVASACGGDGLEAGGAGTIYFKTNGIAEDRLVVDNCGLPGASTPVARSSGIGAELSVSGAGIAELQGILPALSNVTVFGGGVLTGNANDTNINLLVLGNMLIGSGGTLTADGKGYPQGGGPGAGQSFSNQGAGGGYGGKGGASSSGASGGTNYGSAAQPVDRGSGGGFGLGPIIGGSIGGGAIRLTVSEQLIVDGMLTADGADGFQDNSGGGSGGSIWVVARTVSGNGTITANGGSGEPFNGGGGGGGRIAIYSRTNNFTGPIISAGGPGAVSGGAGTVVLTNIPAPLVIAQLPTDVVLYAVSNVDFTFSSPMNFLTASPDDFVLDTPNGVLPQGNIVVTALDLFSVRISFPAQDTIGYYEVHAGPQLEDVYGQPMAGMFIGSFVILPPTISGHITDTNGQPVSFVTLHAGSAVQPVLTDSHGAYSLEVPPGWTGIVAPSKGTAFFIPASRNYVNVATDLMNQNFVLASAGALTLTSQQQGLNFKVSFFGLNGISYQMLSSTNLIDWTPYGQPFMGTNGVVQFGEPLSTDPVKFFRLTITN